MNSSILVFLLFYVAYIHKRISPKNPFPIFYPLTQKNLHIFLFVFFPFQLPLESNKLLQQAKVLGKRPQLSLSTKQPVRKGQVPAVGPEEIGDPEFSV